VPEIPPDHCFNVRIARQHVSGRDATSKSEGTRPSASRSKNRLRVWQAIRRGKPRPKTVPFGAPPWRAMTVVHPPGGAVVDRASCTRGECSVRCEFLEVAAIGMLTFGIGQYCDELISWPAGVKHVDAGVIRHRVDHALQNWCETPAPDIGGPESIRQATPDRSIRRTRSRCTASKSVQLRSKCRAAAKRCFPARARCVFSVRFAVNSTPVMAVPMDYRGRISRMRQRSSQFSGCRDRTPTGRDPDTAPVRHGPPALSSPCRPKDNADGGTLCNWGYQRVKKSGPGGRLHGSISPALRPGGPGGGFFGRSTRFLAPAHLKAQKSGQAADSSQANWR